MGAIGRMWAACLGALLLVAVPASAQQIKPLSVEQDPNGVDMISGKTSPRLPTLSIPAAPRLSFTKVYDWFLFLEGQAIADTWGTENYSLNALGRESESFKCKDLEFCTDNKHGGSTLVPDRWSGNFAFTKGGSAVRIDYTIRDKYQATIQTGDYFYFLASAIYFPDGETLTLAWDSVTPYTGFKDHRPASVTSSTGYKLVFTYQSNTYGTGGWSTLQKAEIVKTSAPTVPLARFTYTTTTVTDLAGRVYTCSNCQNSTSGPIPAPATSMKLPGETATSFTASAVNTSHGNGYTHSRFTTDVDFDGVHYDYTYIQSGITSGGQDIVDQVTVTAPEGYARLIDVEYSGSTNGQSRIKSIRNSLNKTTTYGYGSFYTQLTSVTYPEGNSINIAYDGPVNISELRQKAKPGSGLADIVETAGYTPWVQECTAIACFLPNWTKDAKGKQTDYTWTTGGGLLTQLDPVDANNKRRKVKNTWSGNQLIKEEICEANASGVEQTCGTANSFVRTFTYFGATQLPLTVTVTDGVNTSPLTTVNTYDDAGRLLSVDGPLAGSSDALYYRYDSLGRRTWEIGPVNEQGYRPAARTTYRAADDKPAKVETGRLASSSPTDTTLVVANVIDTTYDAKRLPTMQKASVGSTVQTLSQTSYDGLNREQCSVVRMNPATFTGTQPGACSLGTEGTNGPDRISRKYYDEESHLLKIVQGFGTPLVQDYATYTYTANGKQASLTDARGYRAEMTYDGFDRQSRWYFPSKTATGTINASDYEQYGYDANGNRTSLRKRDGTTLSTAL